MVNVRRGINIRVGFSVYRNGIPEDLAQVQNLRVVIRHKSLPNSSAAFTGSAVSILGNSLSVIVTDTMQKTMASGAYLIEAAYRLINPAAPDGYDPYIIDSDVFTLTDRSSDVGGVSCGDVTVQVVNLTGEVSFCSQALEQLIDEAIAAVQAANEAAQAANDAADAAMAIVDSKVDIDGLNANVKRLQFDTTNPTAPMQIGQIAWDNDEHTLVTHDGLHTHPLGKELELRARNTSGATILNGRACYVTGSTGDNPTIALATNTNGDVAQKTIGVATMDIANNAFGIVTTFGEVNDIDTSALTLGAIVYLGANGLLTTTEPVAPTPKIVIGICVRQHAQVGKLFVSTRPIARLSKLSEVHAPILTDNDVLRYNGTTLRWEVYSLANKADLVGGKIPYTQLPAYVDDVLEYANLAAFPATGEAGKIYVALNTNLTYRWGGTTYVEISKSLALGETADTAYRGDRGKTAYDHSQTTGNPHSTTAAQIPNTPAGTVAATTVQGAINELASDIVQVETNLNDLNVEVNGKINNLSGQFNDTYKQIDGLHNKAIRITGLVETNSLSTRECIVKVDVSAYQKWKMTYPQVNTGTDTRNTLAFYSEDVDASIGSSTSLIKIYGRANPTKFTQVEIPLNAVCALIYVLDYSSDIELSFISNEDALNLRTLPSTIEANKEDADKKNVSVITDVNNLTTNVIDKTQSLIDFLKLVDGEEYTIARTNKSIAFSVENVDDDRIKKVFKFANTSAAQVASFNPNLYFFIPYNEYYTLSFWAGISDEQANANPYLLNLEGRVLTTAAYRDGAIATQTRLSFVPLNKKTAAIYAIDSGGTYDLVANGLQNRIASSGYSTAYDSISALLTDYIVIDGVTLFHYEVKLSGIPSYHFMAAEFINANFNWAIGCKMYVGGVMLFPNTTEDTKEKIYQDNINDVTKENDFNKLQYLESYKLDNDCVDQFEGNGVIKFMRPDFSGYTTKNLHTPFKLITKYDVTRVQKTITNPYSGEKFLMDGYKFHNSNDSAMSVYKSGAQTDYEGTYNESGDNPIFYTSVDTMTTMENPCFQFWIDRSELNGNSLERVYNSQIVRMNIQTARKGMLGNIATNTSALNTWTNIPPTVEIVDVVGDMVCIRAKSLKNYANRWCIWSISGNDVTSVTIYNPTLINSEVIDPYHRYTSISEKNNSQWRGKKIILIGDSQYNNGVVGYKLAHEFGANVIDVHYGGHRLSIGGKYSTNTGVSSISHSWFYQESYRKLVLDNLNVDAFILTFSTNDGSGDADWNGTIDKNKIALVENNYPTYVDIINKDATYTSKLALFNALSDAQKNDTFSFVGCYCSYIKQILEKNPYSKLYICSVPISCAGYLTGTSVPDPSGISDEIGVWRAGYTPDIARTNIEDGFLNKDEQIKAIAKRYHAQLVDFRNECGMTYENFIYHCIDGTHWHEEISYKCAESLIRSME